MSKKEISYLSIMDKMVTDDNKGIRMSSTLFSVVKVKQGSVIGFGVENPVGDDANAQLLGLPGENMLLCFAIDRVEFDKTKQKFANDEITSPKCDKKLVQLRTKLEFYQKLSKKLEKVLNAEIEIEDWAQEVYLKNRTIEKELEDYKMELDLPDEEWGVDENPY
jgi:hypothetical protein